MSTENQPSQFSEKPKSRYHTGRIFGGVVVLVVGSVLLAKQVGADLPRWLFTWQMIVIAVGIYIGARSRFRDWSWLITVGVGVVFLLNDFVEGFTFGAMWPMIVIVVGLSMILNSLRTKKNKRDCF